MKVEMDLWNLIWLLLAFFSCIWAFGKVLVAQFEKRLTEKFRTQDESRQAADAALNETLSRHLAEEREMARQLGNLERDFLNWKGELPIHYVRREDYIRGQVAIEHKQDALYLETKDIGMKLQQLIGQLKGQVQ